MMMVEERIARVRRMMVMGRIVVQMELIFDKMMLMVVMVMVMMVEEIIIRIVFFVVVMMVMVMVMIVIRVDQKFCHCYRIFR